ncbi:hypothetical protein BZA77DRAFT_92655 [Pyronema omphalodes]|nr:hypothetical protein BZA77DRAFT_92655 [Pyronema omphalodes]
MTASTIHFFSLNIKKLFLFGIRHGARFGQWGINWDRQHVTVSVTVTVLGFALFFYKCVLVYYLLTYHIGSVFSFIFFFSLPFFVVDGRAYL